MNVLGYSISLVFCSCIIIYGHSNSMIYGDCFNAIFRTMYTSVLSCCYEYYCE